MADKNKLVKHYLAVSDAEFAARKLVLEETFKGEVNDKPVRFPKKLGAEHPFDFSKAEKIIKNIGVIEALVDKITDAIIGQMIITVNEPNSQELLDDFIHQADLKANIRPWVKEAVYKGNGFMELDLEDKKVDVLPTDEMFVKRNNKKKVLSYNQFVGNVNSFTSGKREPIRFSPSEVAHLTINRSPKDPYGMGLLWSNRVAIENYAGAELDLFKLLSRKAGAPIHVQLGVPGESVQDGDIDGFKQRLQFMNNSTEWVTDANVKMNLLQFANVGDNLIKAAEHALEQIAIGMKVPMSMVGIANIPEGIAKVNDKDFLRFIQSVRTLIEEVVENKILRPVLNQNGLDGRINFQWDLPGDDEKNARLKVLQEAMRNPFMSPELKAGLEKEYAEVLGLEEVVKVLPTPEQAAEQEEIRRREEEDLKQPEVPGVKPTANESQKETIKEKEKSLSKEPSKEVFTEAQLNAMPVSEYVNITELEGFNYSDYLIKILQNLKTHKFEELLAKTEEDFINGLLSKADVDKLRIVLRDGFRKNRTMQEIAKNIDSSIELKDRKRVVDGETKIKIAASKRPMAIARTETVRLANQGLKDLYKENNVSTYRYLAALDDRTSDICNNLNGQIFKTEEGQPGVNMPPMHPMCRSTIIGIVI